jgi:hypothetical protein
VYVLLTTVLFLFPPDLPATGSNMSTSTTYYYQRVAYEPETDYCVAAFAIVFIISTITWFADGRKNYVGPRIEVEFLSGQAGTQLENPVPAVEHYKA